MGLASAWGAARDLRAGQGGRTAQGAGGGSGGEAGGGHGLSAAGDAGREQAVALSAAEAQGCGAPLMPACLPACLGGLGLCIYKAGQAGQPIWVQAESREAGSAGSWRPPTRLLPTALCLSCLAPTASCALATWIRALLGR